MDISKFLKQAKKTSWATATAEAKKGGYENLPDGVYVAQLSSAEIGEAKGDGHPQIVWGYTVLEGDQVGQIARDYMRLDGDESLKWLAIQLGRFEIDADDVDLEQLPELLEDMVQQKYVVKLQLRTNKSTDYQGTRVQKLLPDYEYQEVTEDEEEVKPAPKAATPAPASVGTKPGAKAKPAPEPAPAPEEDDEGVELEVGMKAQFEKDGKTLTGSIKSFDNDNETAVVRVGLKNHTVSYEDLNIVED